MWSAINNTLGEHIAIWQGAKNTTVQLSIPGRITFGQINNAGKNTALTQAGKTYCLDS